MMHLRAFSLLMMASVGFQTATATDGFLHSSPANHSVTFSTDVSVPMSGSSERRLAGSPWKDVDKAVFDLAIYLGGLFTAVGSGKKPPKGFFKAFTKSLAKLVPVVVPLIGGGTFPVVIAAALAGMFIETKPPMDPASVAEKVYRDLSLQDVLADMKVWKELLEVRENATRDVQTRLLRNLDQWLHFEVMQVVFGHACIEKVDMLDEGKELKDVPEATKKSCWAWQQAGAPIHYGAQVALWHLQVVGELISNPTLDNSNAENDMVHAEAIKLKYVKYLEDAYGAYGVYEPEQERMKWLMDPQWHSAFFLWKQLSRGRDCWFSDNREACRAEKGFQGFFECTQSCDVLTSKCGLTGRFDVPFPANPNLYVWYYRSSSKKAIDEVNSCWSTWKQELSQRHENMRKIVQQLTEISFKKTLKFVGCYEGNHMVRPRVDVPANADGVWACEESCARLGYEYFGFECPHQGTNFREVHCECGKGPGATAGRKHDIETCMKFNPRSGRHCSGPFVVKTDLGDVAMGAGSIGSVYKIDVVIDEDEPSSGLK